MKSDSGLSNLILFAAFYLLVLIKRHVVERLLILEGREQINYNTGDLGTYSFNVDLESIEGILCASLNVLVVGLYSLLSEEVLDGGVSDLAVVGQTVRFHSASHVLHVVMRAMDLVFRQLLHSLNQIFVFAIKDDDTAREDGIILHMLIEAWLFSFRQFLLLFFLFFPFFPVGFLEEGSLGTFVFSWVAIQDVASVAAVVRTQFNFEHLAEKVVSYPDLTVANDDFRPAILWLGQVSSLLFDCFLHLLTDLLHLCPAVVD